MGDSCERLRKFPKAVRYEIGQALYQAELAESHPSARPMKGLNAVEIVSNYRGDAYRGIYTAQFKGHIYVLHCFQKKSKTGPNSELIRARLTEARLHFEESKHGETNQG
jgi:phage-related protein